MKPLDLTDLLERSVRVLGGPTKAPGPSAFARPGAFTGSWEHIGAAYWECQQDCIHTVDAALARTVELSKIDPTDAVFLVCGSVARLEYIPGQSDFDFCVIFADSVSMADHKEHALFEDFEKTLRNQIRRRVQAMEKRLRTRLPYLDFPKRVGREITVDVDCTFWGNKRKRKKKKFVREEDLFGRIGRNDEGAYAAATRSQLLQENVLLSGSEELHRRLEETVEQLYGASSDLAEESFPSLCHSFITNVMWSGVVAKAAHVRTSEHTRADHLVGKTLLGRVWVAKLNSLALHLLFWKATMTGEIPAAQVSSTLGTPTLAKVAHALPRLLQEVDDVILDWLEKLERPDERDRIRTLYRRFASAFDPSAFARSPDPSLTDHFRDLLSICLGVRLEVAGGEGAFDTRQIRTVIAANRKLLNATASAEQLTDGLCRANIDAGSDRPSYTRFRRMMPFLPG